MEQLVRVAEQEIVLRHHFAYDNFNFDLSAKGRLSSFWKSKNSVSFSHSESVLTWKFLVVYV